MHCNEAAQRRGRRPMLALALGIVAMVTLASGPARAWWNDEWSLRKKITIDTSQAGANIADPIGIAPVLVRLHVGNFRFAAAKDDGSDLRFVAADDKTPLKHHIEKYDPLLGEALVWVNAPGLKPGARSELWLYYGNRKATPNADAKGTYDPDMVLVYHFAERGVPPQDSSAFANHAQGTGSAAEGALIGTGLRLDGQSTVTLPAAASLALPEFPALTWSTWVKMAAAQPNAVIFSRRDGGNGLLIGLDNGAPFVEVTRAGAAQRATATVAIAAGGWHHLALTADGTLTTLYLDGTPAATLSGALPAMAGAAVIGGDPSGAATAAAPAAPSAPAAAEAAPAAGGSPAPADAAPPADASAPAASPAPAAAPASPAVGFAGDIDELQIAKTVRPTGFIKVAAIGQGPDQAKLISFSVDEETSSWLSGYVVVILKSVTLDGWVVIGILVIMGIISWVVMVDKSGYLGRQAKANTTFIRAFREQMEDDLTVLDRGDGRGKSRSGSRVERRMLRHSSLYRIYRIGAGEIKKRLGAAPVGRPPALTPQSIAAIRAALDAGLVRETQNLNRSIVLLTIAISGGPFLGLLGTVVGVMITFAAIAASGDVNVNAIAPGIAAALVATVAGLGVAIPALFGYNYLITRIKNLTSDMQVFVDEFVARMAESYDGRNDRPQALAAE